MHKGNFDSLECKRKRDYYIGEDKCIRVKDTKNSCKEGFLIFV